MKQKWLFLLLVFHVQAYSQPLQEAVLEECEKGNRRWIELQNNLYFYLDEEQPSPPPQECDEIEAYFHEKGKASYQSLRQKIAELEEAFWEFEEKLAEVISHHAKEGNCTGAFKAFVATEAIEWFTTFLEKNLFGYTPGKQRTIREDPTVNHAMTRYFPYSFVEPPYVSPILVQTLSQPWPSYGENSTTSVELWSGHRCHDQFHESPSFKEELHTSETAFFEYQCVGKTDHDVYVLLTNECTGGKGYFRGLLFVTIEVEPYLADGRKERERVLLKRVGDYFLGDRWFGHATVKGNLVSILTEGYGSMQHQIEPVQETLDLTHFFPSRPLNPLFAQSLFRRREEGPIFCAVYQNKPDELAQLLKEDISEESLEKLVLIASRYGYPACLALLLDHGANPGIADGDRNTPLHYAVEAENVECVQVLAKKNALIEAKNSEGFSPLVLGVKRGRSAVVKTLLEHGAVYDFVDQEGKNLLDHALCDGYDRETAEALFSLEVEANRPEMLPQAAYLGSDLIVKHMIEEGFDVNAKDEGGRTALSNCFGYCGNNKDLATYLIKQGANCCLPKDWDGSAPLLEVITLQDLDLLKLCLTEGADPKAKHLTVTPLYRAVEMEWIEGTRLLIEHGADVNQQNDFDTYSFQRFETPMHAAARVGNLELVQLLQKQGASLFPPVDKTPFAVAAEKNHKEILRYFVQQGFLD